MKKFSPPLRLRTVVSLAGLLCLAARAADSDPIPQTMAWNQIGARATADYHGEGLTVSPTTIGARLHCVFQRLDAEVTSDGLWLTSTVGNQTNERFRVKPVALKRGPANVPLSTLGEVAVYGETVRFSRAGLVEE